MPRTLSDRVNDVKSIFGQQDLGEEAFKKFIVKKVTEQFPGMIQSFDASQKQRRDEELYKFIIRKMSQLK